MTNKWDKVCSWEDSLHQVRWMTGLSLSTGNPNLIPRNLKPEKFGYSYDFIEGECPVNPSRVPALIEFCERNLWRQILASEWIPMDVPKYACYIMEVAKGLDLCDVGFKIASMLSCCTFSPVVACHGDLTLENVVWVPGWLPKDFYPGSFVFIDPGYDRGLPCRELDEAKIVQSMEEYQIRGNIIRGDALDWLISRWDSSSHNVLLASHYLRLIRHEKKHPQWRVSHARKRLMELVGG